MLIRKLRKNEVNSAARLVGLNYSKKDQQVARRELIAMFKNYALKPTYLVAEEKGEILGFGGYCLSSISYHIYEVFWINVAPKHQGKGIGTALTKALIQTIKNIKGRYKANMILLTAWQPRYYARFGFRKIMKVNKTTLLFLRV